MINYIKVLGAILFLSLFTLHAFSQKIPVMTSNTKPFGEASSSSFYSSAYYAWNAFDGEDLSSNGSRWISKPTGTYTSQWIAYEFESSVRIECYSLMPETGGCVDRAPYSWYFQGWDGRSWQNLDFRTGYTIADWTANNDREFTILSPQNYRKYRLYVTETNGSEVVSIRRFRMHCLNDVETLAAPIPYIISDNPAGEMASSSSSYSAEYYAWKAFDGEDASGNASRWISKPTGAYTSQWIAYQFQSQVTIQAYSLMPETGGCVDRAPYSWYFQGWNGNSWENLDYRTGYTIQDWTANDDRLFIIKNPQNYRKYRLYITETNGSEVVSIRRFRMHRLSDGYFPANQIPAMTLITSTGNITDSDITCSSSFCAWKAFDGEDESGSASRWISSPSGTYSSQWIAYQFESQVNIRSYSIMPETGGCVDRTPNTWYFQGWNGSSWENLDYRTGYSIADWETNNDRHFKIRHPQNYKLYRLYVTQTNGSVVVSIRRLRMHEYSSANKIPVMNSAATPTGLATSSSTY